ncbi:putative ATP phosphoribosyltransferase [Microstroma glucosiphilum]|uniref:ATP phosphoribosyltransferase n=1 Tax=Pseudomicrostroma glucosiphilum TaxID=1684307 RepID=A0A316U9Y8_9BASI|nr:putative ATP phosphoribosyltransferase [Pseudomicrostroma glucosiphilum]PWN19825.1 putative ATP phosphoribosyltransferase [Pseudomicrostroma glucosiphilum]
MTTLFNKDALQGRMLFAIPKKGRLYEKCLELLSGADIQFRRQNRLDVALVMNHPMALVFLPAADIPRFVGEGNVDLGITGQDMVVESGLADLVAEEMELGFGKCKLQVQVPEVDEELQTVEALVGKKVATSFDVLSRKYFGDLDAQVNEKRRREAQAQGREVELLETKIEYVGGSVEAACALGVADGIVDLVESGETMRACGLHAIATLLSSQAVLIRPVTPHARSNQALIKLIVSRIRGVMAAAQYVLCQYNIHRSNLDAALAITPGRRAATVSPLEDDGWSAVSAMVKKSEVATVMDRLEEVGGKDIFTLALDNCRT